MSHDVLIALGSNYHQAAHIHWASQRIATVIGNIRLSPVMWTADNHDDSRFYMNRLVSGTTALSPEQLVESLKEIEKESRRSSHHVTIDLDLMSYDGQRYHLRDWPRPYIQQLITYL